MPQDAYPDDPKSSREVHVVRLWRGVFGATGRWGSSGGQNLAQRNIPQVTEECEGQVTVTDPCHLLYGRTLKLSGLARLPGHVRHCQEIETDFAHLKTTLGLDVLHCKTAAGVLKELTIYAIVYNLVRVVMLEASRRQGVPLNRISFVDALRWPAFSPASTPLPELVVNPHRPGRAEPRCKKRRAKKHPYMNHPRCVLRQCLLDKQVPASLNAIPGELLLRAHLRGCSKPRSLGQHGSAPTNRRLVHPIDFEILSLEEFG